MPRRVTRSRPASGLKTLLLTTTLLFAPSVAFAQDAPEAAAAAADEEIVVTGSRLIRNDLTAPSPTTVVGEADIKLSGNVTLEKTLNQFPQLGQGNTSSVNNGGGSGVLTANLRGLGSTRTLTLVNAFGLRVEGHPPARFFDAAAPNPLGGRKEIRELLFAEPDTSPALDVLPDFPDDDVNERYFTHVHAAARIGWEPPAFYDPRLGGRLDRITVSTHIIWGAQNRVVDVAHAKAYEAGIAHATLTVLDDAGQAVTVEQPDQLAAAVVSFLRANEH